MSPNRRIVLNIAATYGRSVYSLIVGLFTARWALLALGHTDYGLVGVVGGLASFVSFFNHILAGAVGRFYAVSVGAARKKGNEADGLEECRKWFNTALSIHTTLPIILMLIGYPCGVWAVRHFLTIPVDRSASCVWVWRFTCVTCFIGMVEVPFRAMYTAKQEIAELTIYSFFTTTANAFFLYYMITHPGIWLAKYSFWTMLLGIVPQFLILTRALLKYPECRFVRSYWYDIDRYRQLGKYAFARLWASISDIVSSQGRSILVNKYMGPAYNASMTVGNHLASHSTTLASSVSGAFWPVIANYAGEGKLDEMRKFCFMTCRLSSVMALVFAVPLVLEVREVLVLWLKNPPDFAAAICVTILLRGIFERMTNGYWMGILGRGVGIMKYSWIAGWTGICTAGVSWIFFACGYGMWSVVIGLASSAVIIVATRVILGETLVGMKKTHWVRQVFCPVILLEATTFAAGFVVTVLLPESPLRVIITTAVCEFVLLPFAWFFVLDVAEREYILVRFRKVIGKARKCEAA